MKRIIKGLGSWDDYGGRSTGRSTRSNVLERRMPHKSWGVISIDSVKHKLKQLIIPSMRIDITIIDIIAKQLNSAIRKGTWVQLIKNGNTTISFMPNDDLLCYFKEALIAGFGWFPVPHSRWWRSLASLLLLGGWSWSKSCILNLL